LACGSGRRSTTAAGGPCERTGRTKRKVMSCPLQPHVVEACVQLRQALAEQLRKALVPGGIEWRRMRQRMQPNLTPRGGVGADFDRQRRLEAIITRPEFGEAVTLRLRPADAKPEKCLAAERDEVLA